MKELSSWEPERFREPKLGIKSSLTDLKQTIGLLTLNFVANPKEYTLKVSAAPLDGKIEFDEEQINSLLNLIGQMGIGGRIEDKVRESISKSPLVVNQIEPLIVGLELFLPLAEVTFQDSKLGKSAEREGGKRYPKEFKYSGGLFLLCGGTRLPSPELVEVLFYWLIDEPVRPNIAKVEKDLKRRIFYLASKTQYRITRQSTSEPSIDFNTLGLYKSLIVNGEIALNGDEKKGTTRPLFSAIKQGLLPGLSYDKKDTISLSADEFEQSGFSRFEIEELVTLQQKQQELLNVQDITRSQTKPSDTGEGVVSSNVDLAFSSNKLGLRIPSVERNVIYYGVPGAGKSYEISQQISSGEKLERVVFHPDYLYANFVGQILPDTKNGEISYRFKPGPFTKILASAINSPEIGHVLVIEEINRGNAAAVFGDIFQLLDRNDEGESKYKINNPEIASYVFHDADKAIGLPSNLRLMATMNTSDQNVYTLDTAFQRRWAMRMVRNDIDKVPYADQCILDTSVSWRLFNRVLNDCIIRNNDGMSSTEDKRLGAFFVSEDEMLLIEDDLISNVFGEKVLKYLWDDALKFNRSDVFSRADDRSLEHILWDFNQAKGDARWLEVFTKEVCDDLLLTESEMANTEINDDQAE